MGRRGRVRWGDFGGSPQIPLRLVWRDIPLLHRENIYPLIPETKLSANRVPGRSLFLPQGLCIAVALPLALPCSLLPICVLADLLVEGKNRELPRLPHLATWGAQTGGSPPVLGEFVHGEQCRQQGRGGCCGRQEGRSKGPQSSNGVRWGWGVDHPAGTDFWSLSSESRRGERVGSTLSQLCDLLAIS